jgi:Secretion system C-terminal sorting domain
MKKTFTSFLSMSVVALLFLTFTKSVKADVGITFTFANPQVTTSGGNNYFEFDIMAVASASSQFKIAQVYINYDTSAFGSDIYSNNAVTVTAGPLLNTVINGSQIGGYSLSLNDNSSSVFSIANTWAEIGSGSATGYDLTNTLSTTAQVYVHVKIKVQDYTQSSDISFNELISQWDQQDYYFTSGDNETIYIPVAENGTLDNGPPLPVQLSSFTASANNNSVNLTWNTATEVNNYGFDVQRMTEGSPNSDWTKVGFVAGSGNSNSPKTYSFTDNNLTGGTKFLYRLKQTDIDGSFEYSDTVEVTVAAQYALYQNYPNPFNPTTIIKFDIPQASRVSLIIYNILGAKVATLVNNESLSAGLHSATFDGRSLASGTYIYRLQAGNYVQIKKMLLLK